MKRIPFDPLNPPKNPEAVNRLETISPSGINTHRMCRRKFHLAKIEGLTFDDGGTPSTNLGRSVHSELELYQREGTPVTSVFAQALVRYLPTPRHQNVLVEQEFHMDTGLPGGVREHGIIDHIYQSRDAYMITDYKTTKNLRYAKSATALRSDPQMLMYGRYGFTQTDLPSLTVRHLYVETGNGLDKPATRETVVDFVRTEIEELWNEKVRPSVLQILDDSVRPWSEVEHNPKACRMFGALCPFTKICGTDETSNTTDWFGEREVTMASSKNPLSGILPSKDDSDDSFVLCVNCAPLVSERPVAYVADFLAAANEIALSDFCKEKPAAAGLKDARLIPYGEGTTRMSMVMAQLIEDGTFDGKTVVLSTDSPIETALVSVFQPKASAVYRNTR